MSKYKEIDVGDIRREQNIIRTTLIHTLDTNEK